MKTRLIIGLLAILPLSSFAYTPVVLAYNDPQLDYVDWSQPNAIEIAKAKQELRYRELQLEATKAEIQQTYSPTIVQQQSIITQGDNNTVVGNQQSVVGGGY
jgi:hypothetical protein